MRQLGVAYSLYRPQSIGNPLASGNQVGTLSALFSQETTFTKPSKTKSDEYYGYFDGSQTQVGDYLTAGDRTFFVTAQQPMLPYLVINCQRVISVLLTASSVASLAKPRKLVAV